MSNYAGNFYIFGNPAQGTTIGENTFSNILDGMSNTLFFAEIYGTCTNTGDVNSTMTYGSLWADSNSGWRPGYNLSTGKGPVSGYPAARMFQVQPHWLNTCDFSRPSSPHVGGIWVGVADGSVRFVAMDISATTWQYANDPRDGNNLGSDW